MSMNEARNTGIQEPGFFYWNNNIAHVMPGKKCKQASDLTFH